MKRSLLLLVLVLASGPSTATADDGTLKIVLSNSPEGKPTKAFEPSVAKIYAGWLGKGILKAGDKMRAVWIAEDTNGAAPANYKIDEWSDTVAKDGANGYVSLSKPNAGWPIGTYRLEVYVGDKLASTRHFAIGKPAASAEKDEDDD